MILSALNDYYYRLVERHEPGICPYGYSMEKISYALLLDLNGKLVDVHDIRDTSGKKPSPIFLAVPAPSKRTVGIKPLFLWDKTSYVLGVKRERKDSIVETPNYRASFKAFHQEVLSTTEDPGLLALLKFLHSWQPASFQAPLFHSDMLDANFVFRLDSQNSFIHESEAAQKLWTAIQVDADATRANCLVTGEKLPIARLHPSIRNVEGAQSSGASIVSFNLDAFNSYNKMQGANAPVSQAAAFSYTTVLNHLLRRSEANRQRIQIGDTTVVFWAQTKAAEDLLADFFNPPPTDEQESGKLRHVLENVRQGRPIRNVDPELEDGTEIFALGLAPNASRLSIRFWQRGTLEYFVRRIADHYFDLEVSPSAWRNPPSIWRLCLVTAPSRQGKHKAEDVPPQLAGEFARAILAGTRYPWSLVATLLMRFRSDGDLSGIRVALVKAVLARKKRLEVKGTTEEIPVSLDLESTESSYVLGRLFSAIENVQKAALGKKINATVRDRFYGAASATPASIFPMLLRNAQNHLSRLRKDKPGIAVNLEREIGQIVGKLGTSFPAASALEAQGRFAIGYYHETQSRFADLAADRNDNQEQEEEQEQEGEN